MRESRIRLGSEFRALAELDHATLIENENVVGSSDGAEPMGDDDAGAVLEQVIDRPLDERLSGGVQARRGFVEHYDSRILQEDPGEREKLCLAGRQPSTPGVEQCVESVGHRGEPRFEFESMDRLEYSRLVDRVVEERQIVSDRSPEQLHVLGDHADALAKIGHVGVPGGNPVESDRPRLGFIEACHESGDRRLAAPCSTEETNDSPRGDRK